MTNEITNQSRPWLNKNGSIKSDAQIKAISKEWSLETWEQFLSETVDQEEVYQRELPSFVSDEILDSFPETIWEGKDSDRMDSVAKELRRICRGILTPRQQHVIRSTFWEGLSERKIGELLGISRSSVKTLKARALEKIKKQILKEKILQGGRQERVKASSCRELTKKDRTDFSISRGSKAESKNQQDQARRIFDAETKNSEFVFKTGGDL